MWTLNRCCNLTYTNFNHRRENRYSYDMTQFVVEVIKTTNSQSLLRHEISPKKIFKNLSVLLWRQLCLLCFVFPQPMLSFTYKLINHINHIKVLIKVRIKANTDLLRYYCHSHRIFFSYLPVDRLRIQGPTFNSVIFLTVGYPLYQHRMWYALLLKIRLFSLDTNVKKHTVPRMSVLTVVQRYGTLQRLFQYIWGDAYSVHIRVSYNSGKFNVF